MNQNKNLIENNSYKEKQLPVVTGLHPEGGYVAWPDGSATRIRHNETIRKGRCIDRKGFVAWPVNE